MQGKLVIRYEMTDEQQALWAADQGITGPATTGRVVESFRACVTQMLSIALQDTGYATIEVTFK